MSSSSMPSGKRRRVDAANETLKKPFRSPMVRRPQADGNPLTTSLASSPATPAPAQRCDGLDINPLSTPSKIPSRHSLGARLRAPIAATGSPSRPGLRIGQSVKHQTGPGADALTDKDTQLLDHLRRRRKEAEVKTREVEKEVDLVKQAVRIQSGKETTNEELAELVRRWKGACRIAAEELFELIQGRVNSMGGAAAWRESRQHRGGWNDNEDAQATRKQGQKGEDADDREELEGLEEVTGCESDAGLEGSEERDFTMHMMLQSLNIDPQVIGYDPVEDKWRDWG